MSDELEQWRPPSREGQRSTFITETEPTEQRRRTWTRPGLSAEGLDLGSPIVKTEGIKRDYPLGTHVVHALKHVDLRVARGTLVAIHGRSGSGKTTLLNLIGGLDQPTEGSVWIDGDEVTAMDEDDLVEIRRNKIGFIFQSFGLIPILTAAENIEIPLRLTSTAVAEREERSRILLELVGLGERGNHRPHELSGGEQQRVAIARSLANGPQLLIADEPTGQLDSRTGRTIMDLIRALVRSEHVTAIVATHDPELIDTADRVLELRDGEIVADSEGVSEDDLLPVHAAYSDSATREIEH